MMKKIIVALAMFPMAAFASGINPGTLEVAGGTNLGFRSSSSKLDLGPGGTQTTDTTAYGLDGRGLYYVNPNFSVGARLAYLNSTDKLAGIENGVSTLFIGPAAAYEQEVAPQVAVFGLATVGYASSTFSQTGAADVKGTGYGFGLEAGLKYFVVKSVSLNAALAYDWTRLSGDSVGGVTPKTTDSGFGLNLGVSVYLGGASH